MLSPIHKAMNEKVVKDKRVLRKKMLVLRNNISHNFKADFDSKICQALEGIVLELKPKIIHSYLPINSEVNVLPFLNWALERNLKIICPKVLSENKLVHVELSDLKKLEKGLFSTMYPESSIEYRGPIDLIITPGLAFDILGNRLGYGGGYYDQFLAGEEATFKLAVLYPFQLEKKIPVEKHDIKVDELILEKLR